MGNTELGKMSEEEKKPFEAQADDCLLACLFVKNCKQWGNENMESTLENLYSSLEENQGVYPPGLTEAAERYEMRFCKAKKNGTNNRNSKSEEEKEGDEVGQALGSHFEVEDEGENENEDEEEEDDEEADVTARVTEMLGLHDDKFEITDNDDISLVSLKSEEEMICMHWDTTSINKKDDEVAEEFQDIIDTESSEHECKDEGKQNVERMVDNQGWFGGNKKRFFPYSKRDEKQVLNPDFCQGGI